MVKGEPRSTSIHEGSTKAEDQRANGAAARLRMSTSTLDSKSKKTKIRKSLFKLN
jgi:hypothetical protein